MSETAKALLALSDRLFSEKQPFDGLCQTIAENFYPERATFTRQVVLGEDFGSDLFDSYPIMARRDLGNSFSSMLRPRGKEWFSLKVRGVKNLSAGGKAWLEGATSTMRAVFYDGKTRFVRTMREGDHDYAAFGNAAMSCEPTRDRSSLIYRCWHLADMAWSEDEYGVPSIICRKDKMTAWDLMKTFPSADFPSSVRNKANDTRQQHEKFDIVHIVMPAERFADFSDRKIRQQWVSAYVLKDGAVLLRDEGVRSKRYIIPRWQTVSGTQYALSPATIVTLPDARMIQKLSMILLEAGEKAVDPPTIAVAGAVLSDVNIFSGGTTWVDKVYDERTGAAVRALETGGNLSFGADLMNLVRSRISDGFYLSKLVMPQGGAKTAYETARLVEEYVRAAIPLFEPLETEYTQPVLDDSFAELMAIGAFGSVDDIPDELAGENIEFSFSNPLQETIETAKANKFAGLAQLLQVAAGMEQAAGQVQVGQEINVNEAFREAGMAISPASWWNDEGAETAAPPAQDMQNLLQAAGGAKTMADAATAVGKAGITMREAFQQPQQEVAV